MESKKDSIMKYYPMPITIEKNKIITNQMEKCICKIKINNNEGIGFFCQIPHQNQKIYTLISNNNILNESIIKEHKSINVTLNDDKENIIIEINENNNNIYINNEYNITIIEISRKIVNNNFFLELDQIIFNDNLDFSNEPIYILHYPKYNNSIMASVSYGILENNDNISFNFYCNIGKDSIGFPILNLSSNKLIGIIKETKEFNYNTGIILKNIIKEFLKNIKLITQNLNENKNENHITILPDIKKTILGPETGEDEEYDEEISNKNKDINESVIIKRTILGPEAYDDEENTEQNINIKSNKLNEKKDINNNNININNYNESNEKLIINNKNYNNIFNSNTDDGKKKTKIKILDDNLDINKELNKKSNNSDNNNNCNSNNNIISSNINKKNENINYLSNKEFPKRKINNDPDESEGYSNSSEIYSLNFNNNNNRNSNNNNSNLENNSNKNSSIQFNRTNNLNSDILNKTSYIPNFSFSMYKNASKTILKDLGNTSYLNSTLQLLGNSKQLANFFLNPNNAINPNISLSFYIQRLFYHFYPYPETDNIEIYEPKYILTFLSTKFGNIDNPNKLIKIILDTLHVELNVFNKNVKKKYPNKFNEKEVIQNEIDNYKNFNNSKIYKYFNWFELKKSLCYNCNSISYELNTYNILELDILNSYNYYKNNKNFITIYDCLAFNQLSKQVQYYCEKCRNYKTKTNTSKIFSSPFVFIFSLNRGNMDQNLLSVRFIIEEKINLVEYVENKQGPKFYELNGIVSINMYDKRYVSCCKSPVDQQWYFYNNERIQKLDVNVIINNHNNNNFIPCLLIYNDSKK